MSYDSLPRAGTTVLVTMPRAYASAPVRYTVADVRDRHLTLHAEGPRPAPAPLADVPCTLRWAGAEGRTATRDALVLAAGASILLVDLAWDPRRHARYRGPGTVGIEVPSTDLGVVEGTLEDISAGGVRVRTPVLLPLDDRAFVSVLLPGAQPLLAVAVVKGIHRWNGQDHLIARLQFTLMSAAHRARLATMLELLGCDGGGVPEAPLLRAPLSGTT